MEYLFDSSFDSVVVIPAPLKPVQAQASGNKGNLSTSQKDYLLKFMNEHKDVAPKKTGTRNA